MKDFKEELHVNSQGENRNLYDICWAQIDLADETCLDFDVQISATLGTALLNIADFTSNHEEAKKNVIEFLETGNFVATKKY